MMHCSLPGSICALRLVLLSCMGLLVLSTSNLTCLISQMAMSMKSGPALGMLPPDLKPMFDPRPPIKYLPPGIGGPNDAPELKKRKKVAPKPPPLFQSLEFMDKGPNPPVEDFEPPKERKKRLKAERDEKHKEMKLKEAEQFYLPNENELATKDAYKTLFVARLSYETSEKKLWREFGSFGQIVSVHVIHNREVGTAPHFLFGHILPPLITIFDSDDGKTRAAHFSIIW